MAYIIAENFTPYSRTRFGRKKKRFHHLEEVRVVLGHSWNALLVTDSRTLSPTRRNRLQSCSPLSKMIINLGGDDHIGDSLWLFFTDSPPSPFSLRGSARREAVRKRERLGQTTIVPSAAESKQHGGAAYLLISSRCFAAPLHFSSWYACKITTISRDFSFIVKNTFIWSLTTSPQRVNIRVRASLPVPPLSLPPVSRE